MVTTRQDVKLTFLDLCEALDELQGDIYLTVPANQLTARCKLLSRSSETGRNHLALRLIALEVHGSREVSL